MNSIDNKVPFYQKQTQMLTDFNVKMEHVCLSETRHQMINESWNIKTAISS